MTKPFYIYILLLCYIGFQKYQHLNFNINIYMIYIFHKHTSISSYITYPQYVLIASWNKIVFHFVNFIQLKQPKKLKLKKKIIMDNID